MYLVVSTQQTSKRHHIVNLVSIFYVQLDSQSIMHFLWSYKFFFSPFLDFMTFSTKVKDK